MGSYTYPCPSCWQQQRLEIANGAKVRHALCAACAEKALANPKGAEAATKIAES
jgi:Zn ribbon nucleic-acid-binding protein